MVITFNGLGLRALRRVRWFDFLKNAFVRFSLESLFKSSKFKRIISACCECLDSAYTVLLHRRDYQSELECIALPL